MATLDNLLTDIIKDSFEFGKDINHTYQSVRTANILGLPVDILLTFVLAAGMYFVCLRSFSQRVAVAFTLAAILLKELGDIFLERSITAIHFVSYWDTMIGIATGLAGIGLGMLCFRPFDARALRDTNISLAKQDALPLPGTYPQWFSTAALTLLGTGCMAILVYHFAMLPTIATSHIILAVAAVVCFSLRPAASVIFIIPAVPFLNFAFEHYGLDSWFLRASDTLLLTMATCSVVSRLIRGTACLRRHVVDGALAIYAFLAMLSLGSSVLRQGLNLDKASHLVCLAVWILVREHFTSSLRIRQAAWALGASMGIVCLIALIEFFVREKHVLQRTPHAVYRSAYNLSCYVTVIAPLVLFIAGTRRIRGRWLFALFGFVALLVLIITASRTAWVSSAVLCSGIVVFLLSRRDWSLGVAALVVVLAVGGLGIATINRAAGRQGAYSSQLSQEILSLRACRFRANLASTRGWAMNRMIPRARERPLLGTPGIHGEKASIYLFLLENHGLLATAFIVVALCWIMISNFRFGIRLRSPMLAAISIGCGFSLFASLLSGITDYFMFTREGVPILWYVISLGPATITLEALEAQNKYAQSIQNREHWGRNTIILIVCAVIVILVSLFALLNID
jgi:hypothetical protein